MSDIRIFKGDGKRAEDVPGEEREMTDAELIESLRLWNRDDAADRIEQLVATNEALTEQLAAARDDAKEAEAYAEELEADRKKTYEALLKVSRIHGEVEAKLAKAVEALDMLVRDCEADYPPSHGAIKHFAIATLAEIKGDAP